MAEPAGRLVSEAALHFTLASLVASVVGTGPSVPPAWLGATVCPRAPPLFACSRANPNWAPTCGPARSWPCGNWTHVDGRCAGGGRAAALMGAVLGVRSACPPLAQLDSGPGAHHGYTGHREVLVQSVLEGGLPASSGQTADDSQGACVRRWPVCARPRDPLWMHVHACTPCVAAPYLTAPAAPPRVCLSSLTIRSDGSGSSPRPRARTPRRRP